MKYTSSKILLKPFDESHLARVREWMNDPVLAPLLDRTRPVTEIEHRAWYEDIVQRQDCVFFAIETIEQREERHIGNVWLWNIDSRNRKAELRIVLAAESCGAGHGSTAIELICEHAFRVLNLHKVYSFVLANNPRAKRSFEKAGFIVDGILREDRWSSGVYVHVYALSRIATDFDSNAV